MTDYRTYYPSPYITAGDLQGQVVDVEIQRIAIEDMHTGEAKPVLYFVGHSKGMVCNKTNAKRIAALYGPNTDDWIGQRIMLYPSETDFGGETVPCLRVKEMAPPAQDAAPESAAPQVKETPTFGRVTL